MNLFEFADRFSSEEKSRSFLKSERDRHGITCKKCGGIDHFWLENKVQWQCRACDYRTTLTSGTVMENTKLPIQKWFLAMFWMTSSKKSISILELMRKLEISRYETVLNLSRKIRLMMSSYNDRITLNDDVEADESFITTAGSKSSNKGRGSNKTLVHILTSYQKGNPSDAKQGKQLKSVKMECIDNASSKSIKQVWDVYLNRSSKIDTDGFKSYKKLAREYTNVRSENASGQRAGIHLPWVHIMASNYKKINLGMFHNTILPHNLQYYLDEFCFKTNLRNHMNGWFFIALTQGIANLWNAGL